MSDPNWTPGMPLITDADFNLPVPADQDRELELSQPDPVPDLVPDEPASDLTTTVEAVRRELARPTPESLEAQRNLGEVPQALRSVPVDILESFPEKGEREMLGAALEAISDAMREEGLELGTVTRNVILGVLADLNDEAGEALAERDAADRKAGLDQLKRERREDVNTLLADASKALDVLAPDAVRWAIENGRDARGSLVLNSPVVVRWLAEIWRGRRDMSPSSPKQRGVNTSERAQIEEVMRTDRQRYMADEAMQARYRQLLAAEQGLGP